MYAHQIFGSLFVLLMVVAIVFNRRWLSSDWVEAFWFSFWFSVIITALVSPVILITTMSFGTRETRTVKIESQSLVALVTREGWNVEGRSTQLFVFGSGTLSGGSSAEYRYMVKGEFGSVPGQIGPAEKDRQPAFQEGLIEGEQARIDILQVQSRRTYNNVFSDWIVPINRDWEPVAGEKLVYQFHIPKGSIEQTIAVGL
jgi:hypothetical protein